MKVWVSVHGRFHAFDLARELHRRNSLAGVATTYPRSIARRFLPDNVDLRSAAWLEALRRLSGAAPWRLDSDYRIGRAFGRFAARQVHPGADVLVGWSGATLEAIEPARAAGMRVIIERGSTHIGHQAALLTEEYRQFGLPYAPVDPRVIERELAEYDAADAIAVPSEVCAATFMRRGVPGEKLIVNPYGADVSRFTSATPQTKLHAAPRILFVGTVGLRKGVPWLLRAFARLTRSANLHLVGPVEKGMEDVLRRENLDRVTIHGPLRSPDLEKAYHEADIFCLPSLEEGFPLALLQAMAAALPIVATAETGVEDVIIHDREGLVVPARDPGSLARALEELVADPSRRVGMGLAGQERIRKGLTWSDYGDRAVRGMERLLGLQPERASLAF